MAWLMIIAGSCGTLIPFFYPTVVDSFLLTAFRRSRAFLRSLLEAPPQPEHDLALVSSLITSLRAGISLDGALESASREDEALPSARQRILRILGGKPGPDFLSSFLAAALESGVPALESLRGMERALQCRKKLRLKAKGITSQCRAQGEVLSWLPWALAAAIAAVDPAWIITSAQSSAAWACWGVALGISGLGRAWMKRIIRLSLCARSERERVEEELLPDFILRVIAELSSGRDAEAAADAALMSLSSLEFSNEYRGSGGGRSVRRVRSLLASAALTGAPLKEDLLSQIAAHQAETESLWEERVQRLPVVLLAPLFICFFPASLLVLTGLLFPLLRSSW